MPRGQYDREAARMKRMAHLQDVEEAILEIEEPHFGGFVRCTTCFQVGHSASECTQLTAAPQPAFKRRCPLCVTAVTQEEFELHRDHGCATMNAPVVREHDDYSRISH